MMFIVAFMFIVRPVTLSMGNINILRFDFASSHYVDNIAEPAHRILDGVHLFTLLFVFGFMLETKQIRRRNRKLQMPVAVVLGYEQLTMAMNVLLCSKSSVGKKTQPND